MRATLPIAFIALLGALFGVLSGAADPTAPAAPVDWQDAIQQLRGEREQAETCLSQLRQHGDAYRIDQGERFYALAKVHMDQAQSVLRDALAGKPAADGTALEAQIDQAIEGRLKLCRLLDGIVPEAAGEKGPLVLLLTRSATATKAGRPGRCWPSARRSRWSGRRSRPSSGPRSGPRRRSSRRRLRIPTSRPKTPSSIRSGSAPTAGPIPTGQGSSPTPALIGPPTGAPRSRSPRRTASGRPARRSQRACCAQTCATTGCACNG